MGQSPQVERIGEPARVAAAELHLPEHRDARRDGEEQALPVPVSQLERDN